MILVDAIHDEMLAKLIEKNPLIVKDKKKLGRQLYRAKILNLTFDGLKEKEKMK